MVTNACNLKVLSDAEADCAGRFQCSKCPSRGKATAEYIFLLLLVILVNAFLIWLLLPEDISDWDHQGSSYVEV